MIHTLPELLAATGAADVDELAMLVNEETELDGSLDVEDTGVTVVVDWFWCETLEYPFTVEQLWLAVLGLDDESLQDYEDIEESGATDEIRSPSSARRRAHQFVTDRETASAGSDERNT